MRNFLRRCGQALVMGSICAAFVVAGLAFLLRIIGGLLNELSNALALLADELWNSTARKRKGE
jgi:hypothetical protein